MVASGGAPRARRFAWSRILVLLSVVLLLWPLPATGVPDESPADGSADPMADPMLDLMDGMPGTDGSGVPLGPLDESDPQRTGTQAGKLPAGFASLEALKARASSFQAPGPGFIEEPAPQAPPCPESVPGCPWTEASLWWDWIHEAPLDEVTARSTDLVAAGAKTPFAPLDTLQGYHEATPEKKRQAWTEWWLLVAQHHPAMQAAQESAGSAPAAQQEGGEGGADTEEPEGPKVGKPRNLLTLWRLQAHGTPIAVHGWGDSGQLVLTNLGAFHFPSWEEPADWMVRFDSSLSWFSPVGRSEVVPGAGAGEGLLVIEYQDPWGWFGWDTLRVIDLADGSEIFRGFARERAAQAWTLTDVNDDGTHDLLVAHAGAMSAVALPTGDLLYEAPLGVGPLGLALGILSFRADPALAFGDATDDGVQDLFVVRAASGQVTVDDMDLAESRVVTLFSGASGAFVRESVPELQSDGRFMYPGLPVTGDLDGDGNEDLVYSELRDKRAWGGGYDRTVMGISGEDGRTLFYDRALTSCPDPACADSYQPLAVIPGPGGRGTILGMEGGDFFSGPPERLMLRVLAEVDGVSTAVTASVPVTLPISFWYHHNGRIIEWQDEGAGNVLVSPFADAATRFTGGVYRLHDGPDRAYIATSGGIEEHVLDEGVWDLFVDRSTGQASAWFGDRDRWAPLSSSLERTGDGHRLLVNVVPSMWHDADSDGIPDGLVSRTQGYYWVSGKDGTILREVDVEPGANWRWVGHDGSRPFMLELRDGTYSFGGLEAEEPDWSFDEEKLEEGSLWGFSDLTGDGRMELVIRNHAVYDYDDHPVEVEEHGAPAAQDQEPPGRPDLVEEGRWRVYQPVRDDWLWELKDSDEVDMWVIFGMDMLPDREGSEIVVVEYDWESDEGNLALELHAVGDKKARWRWDLGERDADVYPGYVLVVEEDEDEPDRFKVDFHRASDRKKVSSIESTPTRPLLDGEFMELVEGEVHLVYSYGTKLSASTSGEPEAQQRWRVMPLEGGTALADFSTLDEGAYVVEDEEGKERIVSAGWGETTYLMGGTGDWSGSGVGDLLFIENGHYVVRSSTTGSILSVAPNQGSPCCMVDLNRDDAMEFGLYRYDVRNVRMLAYDGEAGEIPDEDASGNRYQLGGDENQTRERDRFFDDRSTPLPLAFVLLAFVAALAGVRRRRD